MSVVDLPRPWPYDYQGACNAEMSARGLPNRKPGLFGGSVFTDADLLRMWQAHRNGVTAADFVELLHTSPEYLPLPSNFRTRRPNG